MGGRTPLDPALVREVDRLAALVRSSQPVVALTGAGVSTESGLPDFRSPGTGLWNYVDPMEFASVGALRSRPAEFWRGFAAVFGSGLQAAPNQAHLALARLEAAGLLDSVITQNIDGLHTKAGSVRVYEIHGSLRTASCQRCGRMVPLADALRQLTDDQSVGGREPKTVPVCSCGGILRPDVVLFEDPMPPAFEQAWRRAAAAGLILVVGSSLEVYPAASLVGLGRRLAIINLEPTTADRAADLVIRGPAGPVLSELARRLGV